MSGMVCKVHKINKNEVLVWAYIGDDEKMGIKTKFPRNVIPEQLKVGDKFAWICGPDNTKVNPQDIRLEWTEEEIAHSTDETMKVFLNAQEQGKQRTYLVLFHLFMYEDQEMTALPMVLYAEREMTEEEICNKFLDDFIAGYGLERGTSITCCLNAKCKLFHKMARGKFCNECATPLGEYEYQDPDRMLDMLMEQVFRGSSVGFPGEIELHLTNEGWELWQRPSPCHVVVINGIRDKFMARVTKDENPL